MYAKVVVIGPSDRERFQTMLSRDSAHVGPQARLDLGFNSFAALLGREDTMKQ